MLNQMYVGFCRLYFKVHFTFNLPSQQNILEDFLLDKQLFFGKKVIILYILQLSYLIKVIYIRNFLRE